MYRRTEANCDWGSMSLPRVDLDASCKALTGREYSGSPLKHLVRPAPELMSRLLKIHEMIGQLAKTTPDILSLPEVARALEQELILVMIRCLTEGCSLGLTSGGRRHDMIIARFEEFLDTHPGQPLYLTEICAEMVWRNERCASPARSIWGWAQFAFFPCGECILSTARFSRRIRRRQPSLDLRLITASGNWGALRSPIAPRLASHRRNPCEGLQTIGLQVIIARHHQRVGFCIVEPFLIAADTL
jgi:hypothetical protein